MKNSKFTNDKKPDKSKYVFIFIGIAIFIIYMFVMKNTPDKKSGCCFFPTDNDSKLTNTEYEK